ncbi:MAG: hypothetical protein JWM89_521 [Acidimicrobiales bacterium]|nr:hypothetical protein [Acidimicrobiales bacterium]
MSDLTEPNDEFASDEPVPDPPLREVESGIPEADAIEQHQDTVPDDVDDQPATLPFDVPEADLLEQARVLPDDDAVDPDDR